MPARKPTIKKCNKKGNPTYTREVYTEEESLKNYRDRVFVKRHVGRKPVKLAVGKKYDDIYIESPYGKVTARQVREKAPFLTAKIADFDLDGELKGKYADFMQEFNRMDIHSQKTLAALLYNRKPLPDDNTYTAEQKAAVALLHTLANVSEEVRKKGAKRVYNAYLKRVMNGEASLDVDSINNYFDFSLAKPSSARKRASDLRRLKLKNKQSKGGADWGRRQIGDIVNYLAAEHMLMQQATKQAKDIAKDIVSKNRSRLPRKVKGPIEEIEKILNKKISEKLENKLDLIFKEAGIRSGLAKKIAETIAKEVTNKIKTELKEKVSREEEVIGIATKIADSVAIAVLNVVQEVKEKLKNELKFEHSSNQLLDKHFSDLELDDVLSDRETSANLRLRGARRHYLNKEVIEYINAEWPDKYDLSDDEIKKLPNKKQKAKAKAKAKKKAKWKRKPLIFVKS